MTKREHIIKNALLATFFALVGVLIGWVIKSVGIPTIQPVPASDRVVSPGIIDTDIAMDMSRNETIEETGSFNESSNPYFWVNSGGELIIRKKIAMTLQGDIAQDSEWHKRYAQSSPLDTDEGIHPQNLFRLLTRSLWDDASQEVYFRVRKDNLSVSANRNESNGVMLINRYQDSDDLYYVGIRVDGMAVIKKKINGRYYTLQDTRVFEGPPYDREKVPSLLPKSLWIGLRSEVKTLGDGSVEITASVDKYGTGFWTPVLKTIDAGETYGRAPLLKAGYAGIRTDFMDVEFSKYHIEKI